MSLEYKPNSTIGNTSSRTFISASTAAVDVSIANNNRVMVAICNTSASDMYVIEGGGGGSGDFSYILASKESIFISHTTVLIQAFWDSDVGGAMVTETTI